MRLDKTLKWRPEHKIWTDKKSVVTFNDKRIHS